MKKLSNISNKINSKILPGVDKGGVTEAACGKDIWKLWGAEVVVAGCLDTSANFDADKELHVVAMLAAASEWI